ncbi:hypothetical protein VaNZ11_002665 [Volvox africanus]|uniref:UspA domain-containing protein n=1 Tax=Volvox africanus TaxID=51714 RepID=A0ABQ5RU01_9CHLO|nr:hypothetical protein VaNZ11_002665 [Volvox africanus]
MGAGASAQSGIFGPPDGTLDPEAEWRSENVRELDRLGGNQRPAIKRGESTKYRLEWLKEALHEQSDRLEEALAKDPLAGRHEIIRQQAAKLARNLNVNHHRFTVREWQTMKHTDLRALQAREEIERRLQERDKSGAPDQDHSPERPAWNALHWSANEFRKSAVKLQLPSPGSPTGPSATSPSGSKLLGLASAPATEPADDLGAQALEHRPSSPSFCSMLPPGVAPVPAGLLGALVAETGEEADAALRVARPLATNRTSEPPAEWRLRIIRAKRKAMMVISVVLAFRGRKYRARGLQRLDSLSYFIAQHLGPDLQRFTEEQMMYRHTRATAADLQALAEEVWRQKNYRDHPPFQEMCMGGSLLVSDVAEAGDSMLMAAHGGSARYPLGPGSPGGNGGGFGAFKPSAAPQLRLSLPAAGFSCRANSPLLRSRPTNLTPTMHHHGPAVSGNGASPSLPASSQALGAAGGIGPPRNIHPPAGSHQPPLASSNSVGSAAAAAASSTSLSGSLPVLCGHSSGRISMPSGLAAPPGLEAENSGGTAAAVSVGVVVGSGVKNARFSAPGCELLPEDDPGGVGSGDALPVAVPAPVVPPQPSPLPSPSRSTTKRWSSPRFARRSTACSGTDGGEGSARVPHGPATSSGSIGTRRVLSAVAGEDMSMVARAQSWAGPSPLQPLVTNGGGSGGSNARSTSNDNMPFSPSGMSPGAVLPAPPALPSPVGRNPRNRREPGLVLTGSASTASLPQAGPQRPPLTRSPTTTGDGCTAAAASAAVATVPPRNSRRAGSVTRSGSAASSGGGAGIRRRPARVGGSATGEPGCSPLRSVSPYAERLGGVASRRSIRCNSTIRRMVRDGSSDQLFTRYQEEAAALERPLRMMHLFANRANARWVEELADAQPAVPGYGSGIGSTNALTALNASGVGGSSSVNGNGAAAPLGPGWETPYVYDGLRFSAAVGAAQASVFRAEVATMLRAGRMAVQLLAGDEYMVLGDGQTQPLWSADPWDLIASSFPAKAAVADRVRAVHLGPRLLMALVLAVEALAGPEAVAKLVVVLHINDSQQAEVVRELRFRKYCGLRPENIILVVEQRRPGYYWKPEQTVFVAENSAPPASVGSGYAIMQLMWPEEALQIPPEEAKKTAAAEAPSWAKASGATAVAAAAAAAAAAAEPPPLVSLGTSVLDHLTRHGVEWLLTRRLRDISLYNPDLTLDSEVLSYMLYLHDHLGANMAVQVAMMDSLTAARSAQTGIVLAPPRPRRATSTGSGAASVAAAATPSRLGTSMSPRRAVTYAGGSTSSGGGLPLRAGSDVASASQPEGGAPGGGLHPHFVVDIKNSDTQTPRAIQMLTDMRSRSKCKLAVSTQRYLWRLDVLQSLVQRASIFHPCLEVADELVYLTFDMADLTAATGFGARCAAVSGGPRPVRCLNTPTDLEELLGAILAQDTHAPFRRLAANVNPAYGPTRGATTDRSPPRVNLHPAVSGAGPAPAEAPNGDCSAQPHHPASASGGGAAAGYAIGPTSDLRSLNTGQRIVMLLADNESTSMAVQLLMALVKPGRDRVILVTMVPSIIQEANGRMLLRKHEMSMNKTMVDVKTELLTKGTSGSLIEQLESFIDEIDPQLVVMGSQVLASASTLGGSPSLGQSPLSSNTSGGGASVGGVASLGTATTAYSSGSSLSNAAQGAVLGSVAVSLLRNSTRPMLIVKANAKYASVLWDKDKLRVVLEVHHSSRNLLRYVCSKMISPPRHDKVFLMRGGTKDPSQHETMTSRRLLESFSDIATQHKVGVVRRALEESFEAGAIKWADHDKAHIIAVHAAAGRGLSNTTLHILRAARSAVLVYKSNEQHQ